MTFFSLTSEESLPVNWTFVKWLPLLSSQLATFSSFWWKFQNLISHIQFGFVLENAVAIKSLKQQVTTDENIQTELWFVLMWFSLFTKHLTISKRIFKVHQQLLSSRPLLSGHLNFNSLRVVQWLSRGSLCLQFYREGWSRSHCHVTLSHYAAVLKFFNIPAQVVRFHAADECHWCTCALSHFGEIYFRQAYQRQPQRFAKPHYCYEKKT